MVVWGSVYSGLGQLLGLNLLHSPCVIDLELFSARSVKTKPVLKVKRHLRNVLFLLGRFLTTSTPSDTSASSAFLFVSSGF